MDARESSPNTEAASIDPRRSSPRMEAAFSFRDVMAESDFATCSSSSSGITKLDFDEPRDLRVWSGVVGELLERMRTFRALVLPSGVLDVLALGVMLPTLERFIAGDMSERVARD